MGRRLKDNNLPLDLQTVTARTCVHTKSGHLLRDLLLLYTLSLPTRHREYCCPSHIAPTLLRSLARKQRMQMLQLSIISVTCTSRSFLQAPKSPRIRSVGMSPTSHFFCIKKTCGKIMKQRRCRDIYKNLKL